MICDGDAAAAVAVVDHQVYPDLSLDTTPGKSKERRNDEEEVRGEPDRQAEVRREGKSGTGLCRVSQTTERIIDSRAGVGWRVEEVGLSAKHNWTSRSSLRGLTTLGTRIGLPCGAHASSTPVY